MEQKTAWKNCNGDVMYSWQSESIPSALGFWRSKVTKSQCSIAAQRQWTHQGDSEWWLESGTFSEIWPILASKCEESGSSDSGWHVCKLSQILVQPSNRADAAQKKYGNIHPTSRNCDEIHTSGVCLGLFGCGRERSPPQLPKLPEVECKRNWQEWTWPSLIPGVPSTLSPPSYTASPCGQTRPVVWQIRTAVPESRPSQLAASWRPTLADKGSSALRQRRADRRHMRPRRGLYYFMQHLLPVPNSGRLHARVFLSDTPPWRSRKTLTEW